MGAVDDLAAELEALDRWDRENRMRWSECFGRLAYRMYEGTVPYAVRARRRAAGRVARASRKGSR